MKKFRVYKAPDGCLPSFCGEFDTLSRAQAVAEKEPSGLPKYLWETARKAGHACGMYAPDANALEADEPESWHGKQGRHYVVVATYPS